MPAVWSGPEPRHPALGAVLGELAIESVVLAEEMATRSPDLYAQTVQLLDGRPS